MVHAWVAAPQLLGRGRPAMGRPVEGWLVGGGGEMFDVGDDEVNVVDGEGVSGVGDCRDSRRRDETFGAGNQFVGLEGFGVITDEYCDGRDYRPEFGVAEWE